MRLVSVTVLVFVIVVENRLVGMKSRGVYETPGGSIIYYAHNELKIFALIVLL